MVYGRNITTIYQEKSYKKDQTGENGELHGVTETYTLNILTNRGVLTERTNFKNGKQNGLYEIYSFEKCPISPSQICSNSNSSLLKERGNVKDGKKNGLSETFHDNGQLDVRGNYKDGKEEGLWEFFYENGQLDVRGNYKDGKEEGLFEYF